MVVKTNNTEDISERIEKVNAEYKQNEHLIPDNVHSFHTRVLQLFEDVLRSEFDNLSKKIKDTYKAKKYLIKSLLIILLKFSEQYQSWGDKKSLTSVNGNKFTTSNDLLIYIWERLKGDKELIEFLEKFNCLSKSIKICLMNYSFLTACRLAGFYSPLTVIRIIFAMPLTAGIIVGWLFLLQAGDAIKYFARLIIYQADLMTVCIRVGAIIALLLGVNYIFIYTKVKSSNTTSAHRASAGLVLFSFLASWVIGYFVVSVWGSEWLLKDIMNFDQMNPKPVNADIFPLVFAPIWAAMSVFIGIFAQVIWSGRGPIELLD